MVNNPPERSLPILSDRFTLISNLSSDYERGLGQAIQTSANALDAIVRMRQEQESLLDLGRQLDRFPPLQSLLAKYAQIPHPDVTNAFDLISLYQFESICLLDDLIHSFGPRRSMYARLLALCIYESCSTIRSLLGRRFREEVATRLGRPELNEAIKYAHKAIHDTFEIANAKFGDVRNGLVAHREDDAGLRAKLLGDVDEDLVFTLANGLREPLTLLTTIHNDYLQKCYREFLADFEAAKQEISRGRS